MDNMGQRNVDEFNCAYHFDANIMHSGSVYSIAAKWLLITRLPRCRPSVDVLSNHFYPKINCELLSINYPQYESFWHPFIGIHFRTLLQLRTRLICVFAQLKP